MKKIVLVILMVLAISVGVADAGFFSAPGTQVQEEDGSPDVRALTLKVTNGSLTDNGDGTASITTSGGSSEWTDAGNYLIPSDANEDVQIDGDLTVAKQLTVTTVLDVDGGTLHVDPTNNRAGVISYVWATASSETGDTRAIPVMLYGKTSGGAFKQILVDADGILQTTT